MSSEWVTSSLLDHYEVRSGLSKPAKDFGSGHPFLTFKDVFYNYFTPESLGDFVQSSQKERETCSVLRGDVFLTRTSETMHELGMSCVALRDYIDATFNGFCKRLRPKPDSDLLPEYVGYYLRSPKFRQAMLALSSMSTRASLNNEMIGRLEISFPPSRIQTRISEILKSLDDRITLLRGTNATLEAIAQALFKSWFVDFDPVRAKQEGQVPEGMDEATAALFPDGFEESALGAVPRGWRGSTLGESCSYLNRGISPKYLEHGGVLVINQKCVRDFAVDLSKARRHDASLRRIDGRELAVGDVLVNSTGVGTLGRVAQVLNVPETAIVDSHVTVVRAGTVISWPYLGLVLMRMQPTIEAMGEGTTGQTELSRGKLAELKMVVPPAPLLKVFDATVTPLKLRIAENAQQAQTLSTLRDTLLPRLISGQLRLPDAAAVIAEAVI